MNGRAEMKGAQDHWSKVHKMFLKKILFPHHFEHFSERWETKYCLFKGLQTKKMSFPEEKAAGAGK